MLFVNQMPAKYRPHLVAYQNYNANLPGDQAAVYSALFGSARYGFNLDLLSFDSYSAQMHNLNMAISMYTAMGASRHQDVTNWPATIDLRSEGSSLSTNRQMVVSTGTGTLSVSFTEAYGHYTVTNLSGSALQVRLTLPGGRTISALSPQKRPSASSRPSKVWKTSSQHLFFILRIIGELGRRPPSAEDAHELGEHADDHENGGMGPSSFRSSVGAAVSRGPGAA